MINGLWLSLIPAYFINRLGPLSLVLIGLLVEKKVVGRIATFSNTLAINLHAYTLASPPVWLVWYANPGLVMGLIALIAYKTQTPLNKMFYTLSWAYCSIVVGLLILCIN